MLQQIGWSLRSCNIFVYRCHYLKNGKAQRTKALLPIIKASRRAILLSGTPALSRPMEVFWQLHALDDKQWTDPADFNKRYCSGRRKKDDPKDTNEDGEKKKEYSAASNLEELHTLLRATLMLRRNKASILTQLPPKRRACRRVRSNTQLIFRYKPKN